MAGAPERARCSIGKLDTIIICAASQLLLAPLRLFGLPKLPLQGAGPRAAVLLGASDTRNFQLCPGEHKNFLYEAEAQTAIGISFVQTEEMLSVTWSSGGALQVPRTNDAGLRSAIRFSIVSGEKTEEIFEVSCLHTRLSCAGTITVSEAHPATDADMSIAPHEQMLAEAEHIRRHGNETSWPVALGKSRTVAEFFRASGDGADGNTFDLLGTAAFNMEVGGSPTVPEPSGMLLLLCGIAALVLVRGCVSGVAILAAAGFPQRRNS
jgi:hypothetical protein